MKKGTGNLIFILCLIMLIPTVLLIERKHFRTKTQQYLLPEETASVSRAYAMEGDKSFVVIVFAQDGEPFSAQNIDSILNQKYDNYRVIFVNLGDDQTTFSEAKEYVHEHGGRHAISFVQNSGSFSSNYHHIISACRDDEIVVQMDAKDWFASDFILDKLNEAYGDPDVWLTYGQYLEYPSLRKGRVQGERATKKQRTPWVFSRLKTFYAGLFKEVQKEEEEMGNPTDPSFLFPMVEMAKWHVRFIPEVLYIKSNTVIATPDQFSHSAPTKIKKRADCVLFSRDQPKELQECLDSVTKHLHDINVTSVIFESSSENHALFNKLQDQYSKVRFREVSKDVKEVLSFTLSETFSKEEYVFLIPCNVHLIDEIFSSSCIDYIEKTEADAFYFQTSIKSASSILSVPVLEGIRAWSLAEKSDICDLNRLTMVLQKKESLREAFDGVRFKSIESFVRVLKHIDTQDHLGLFFERARVYQ